MKPILTITEKPEIFLLFYLNNFCKALANILKF